MYVCMHVGMCVYVCMYACIHINNTDKNMIYQDDDTHLHTPKYIYIHTYVYVYMYIHEWSWHPGAYLGLHILSCFAHIHVYKYKCI